MLRIGWRFIFMYLFVQTQTAVQGFSCKWDVFYCTRNEVSCGENDSILLDAKSPLDEEHCFAIKDKDNGDYGNYEIEVDLLSLESVDGQNSGYIGMVFNVLDQMNYDFVYLEIHDSIPPPPQFSNQSRTTTPAFISGYRLNGEYNYDERIVINNVVEGTIFHSLRLVIDNNSVQSTKVFLDKQLVGSFQEHFVPRLKGGVFVTHKFGSVGLFRNFKVKGCNEFNSDGKCIDGHAYCVKIVTGLGKGNDGNLQISVNGIIQVTSTYFSLGEVALDSCFSTLAAINVVNPTTNAWVGNIIVTDNGATTTLACDRCTGREFDGTLVVNGNNEGINEASTQCLNGRPCTLNVAEKFYLDDGCQSNSPTNVEGVFQRKSFQSGVRCCSLDGTTCVTPGSCGPISSCDYGPVTLMTYDDAKSNCTSLNRRLCTKTELLSDVCCGTGGCCDHHLVWTSTPGQ